MKKLKGLALVALFATAMFQPMDADAKDKIKEVSLSNGCTEIHAQTTILWGLIVTHSEYLGTYCPDDGDSEPVDLNTIDFDNLKGL